MTEQNGSKKIVIVVNALSSGGRSNIEEADADFAIDAVVASSHQYFKDTYELATRSNQPGNLLKEALTACALTRTDEGGFFAPGAVKEPLSSILGKSVEIANFQNHLLAYIDPKRGPILKRKGETSDQLLPRCNHGWRC